MKTNQPTNLDQSKRYIPFRVLIGAAGVSRHEPEPVKRVGFYFGWLMLIIVFWLPFQWHFSLTGVFSFKTNLMINWGIWSAFAIETMTLTLFVKRKWKYLFSNWLNLAIIITGFPLTWNYIHFIAIARLFRIILTINILVPWLSQIRVFFTKNHLGIGILVFIIGTFLSGLLISSVDPAINDPLEGIWWAWQTFTTVGYGDFVPVSWPGRIISIVVMLMGICLISLLTANFSAFLIGKETEKEEKLSKKAIQLVEELNEKIDRLEKSIATQHTNK